MQNLYLRLAPFLLAIIEALLLILACVLILFHSRTASPSSQPPAFHSIERFFSRLAGRQRLCVLLIGLAAIAVRLGLIPILSIPQPRFNDEFSYLLAADTFAHGKLTNPTHPMWIHFESFHIIQQPTYMSMYPPAQGLVLAAGQLLSNPWIGQVLITALMCSTLCWMLQAWLPPPWALFGAALAVLRLGILSYWMNTYWCASVAAFGGALVLGAWPRLRRDLRVRDSLLMGLGLVVLANSRPFEGLVFSLPVAAAMLWWLASKKRPALKASLSQIVLPLLLILVSGALATGYYYRRVTGDPFRMTYQVNRATYATAPYFLWQTPRPEPVYHHAVMRDFYRWELGEFEKNHSVIGFSRRALEKAYSWWQFYLGPLLTLPLLALPWVLRESVLRQPKMRLLVAICAAMIVGFAVQTWTLPHYYSPAVGALYILLVQCVRYLWHWRPGNHKVGPSLVRMIPVLACSMILLRVAAAAGHLSIEPAWPRGDMERHAILIQLKKQPGLQLVIVRYDPHHDPVREWVYNDADIDNAKVVWARDMGQNDNQELLRYFHDRKVWLVQPDSSETQVLPYPN
jgi:hypothetical protein